MEQSKALMWVVGAVIVLALGGLGWHFLGNSTPTFNTPSDTMHTNDTDITASSTDNTGSSTDTYYQPPADYQPSGS